MTRYSNLQFNLNWYCSLEAVWNGLKKLSQIDSWKSAPVKMRHIRHNDRVFIQKEDDGKSRQELIVLFTF